MSLSWLDTLTLVLHPRQVRLERQPWRGQPIRLEAPVADPQAGEAAWQAAFVAASGLLAGAPRGAALRIVVADHFARYVLLPWSIDFVRRKARLELARGLFRSALGERAAALEITVDAPAFARNGLAAGLDAALLEALRGIARSRRLRLASVQPRLIAEFSARRKQVGDGCFVSLDRDWLALMECHDGQVVGIRNHRTADTDGELAGVLASLPSRGEAGAVRRLHVAGSAGLKDLADGWQATCWPGLFAGTGHA